MRSPRATALCLSWLAASLAGCGDEATEVPVPEVSSDTEPTVAPLDPAEPTVEAAHGGTLVSASPYEVEVVTHDDGALEAWVLEPALEAPGQARLTVRLATEDGSRQPVVMTWDPARERFRGQLHRDLPVPGPLEVELEVGGETARGESSFTIILPPEEEPTAALDTPRGGRGGSQPAAPSTTPTARPEAPAAASTERDAPRAVVAAAPERSPVVAPTPAPTVAPEPRATVTEEPAAGDADHPRGGPPGRVRVRAVQQNRSSAAPPSRGRGASRGHARVRVRDDDEDD